MGVLGDRVAGWAEATAQGWKDRVGGWFANWAAQGIVNALERQEPGAIEGYSASLTRLRDNPLTPPELRAFLDRSLRPGNPISVIAAALIMVVQSFGVILGGSQPLANLVRYQQDKLLGSARLDPQAWITAWRRDPNTFAPFREDLVEQGWTPERIDAWLEATRALPGVSDMIRMAVREVFSPDIVARFGQMEDYPAKLSEVAALIGLTEEWTKNYWAAHWELPSTTEGYEMLRRGIINPADLSLLLRVRDVMPYWRPKLEAISWEVPTRVDVRRFWDMQTIDEARMREIYQSRGYHGRDLDDYVIWTKVYSAFPDLLARYKNGWITLDDVKRELTAMGMSEARVTSMIEEKIKRAAPERVAAERDLTKADIIGGVKKNVITRLEGAELLESLGYSADEAVYLLAVNIPTDAETSQVVARELSKGDIKAALKAGVITESEARTRLAALRYAPADVNLLMRCYLAVAEPPTEPAAKAASKADILAGVKKGVITAEAGYLMLLELGYDDASANFILAVQAASSPFSPTNYAEFLESVQQYRRATGKEAKPVSEELKAAAAALVSQTGDVDRLRTSLQAEQARVLPLAEPPPAVAARIAELRTLVLNAERALFDAKNLYQTLLAAYRAGK